MTNPIEQAAAGAAAPADPVKLEITASRQFPEWLAEHKVSLAFTTYQSGKLFLIGLKETGRLSVFERTFTAAGRVNTTWKYGTGSSSACRAASHSSRAAPWHFGQCRLRQEL